MVINAEQQEQLQAIELDMLKEFITICEKLQLRYYVIGGTLLGAVRHKGFIPWDDDIDIGMLREDYEKFMLHAGQMLPPHLFLQNFHTDPKYYSNAAKIRNSNTTYIESAICDRKINHGIFIDIFPLDNYPATKREQVWLSVRKRIPTIRINGIYENRKKDSLIKAFCRKKTEIIYPTVQSAVKARDRIYTSVKFGGKIVNHSGMWGEKEIVPAEWYAEGCDLEFEGIVVKAPKEYKKWLTQVYGDYMQLPPEEKRVTHHETLVIDMDKPYTEYVYRSGKEEDADSNYLRNV